MNSEDIQRLADLRDSWGILFTPRPYSSIDKLVVSDGVVKMRLTVHRYTVGVTRTRLTGRGTQLIVWTPDRDGTYTDLFGGTWKVDSVTLWDDTFEPVEIHQIGRIETPAEYHARRRWEAQTYRVGTDKSPMDNADVSADPKMPMYNYWMKG